MIRFHFNISPETLEALRKIKEEHGCSSVAALIRLFIAKGIKTSKK